MKIYIIYVILIIISALIISCSCEDKLYDLPDGNLTKLDSLHSPNKAEDDVAAVQQPELNFIENPCIKEFTETDYPYFHGIRQSSRYIKDFFSEDELNKKAIEYLTEGVESITFNSRNSGFASFSHAPSEKYAGSFRLPISGATGGTDIFEFHNINGRYEFNDVGKSINSEFWDSHPFIVSDGFGTDLLIWSSDRKENFGGYSYPYSNKGNTDLYYAFRKNGIWSQIRNFADVSKYINTIYNEQTPSLYCLCYNPILLFSSNRKKKDSTYDIYYSRIEIDFINQAIKQITAVRELESFADKAQINTTADEKFPFIPYPVTDSIYIYFASNRFSDEFKVKDTIINKRKTTYFLKNVGAYDLYKARLDEQEFKCAGIPPKIYLVVRLNEISIDYKGDTIYFLEDIPNSIYKLNSDDRITREKYEVEPGKEYKIWKNVDTDECNHGFCKEIYLRVPEKILKDTTIELILTCIIQGNLPHYVNYSYERGLAFFVTGYWWPTTSRNYKILMERTESKCLTLSNFIDSTDYKPDEEPFYIVAAKLNDNFLNNELFIKIDSVLKLIDKCNAKQKLLITIHGFTDPCPLRTIYDTLGNIIQDSTKYTCDGTIEFNNVVIPTGEYMKFPNLRTTDGKPYRLSWGSQQGNLMLAMLRAYYTKRTIEEGFRAKFGGNEDVLDRFDRYVNFQLDAFGIFDNIKQCQYSYSNIAGLNLINDHFPPEKFEPCNLPHSRRVMIYMDVVNNDKLGSFRRFPCEKKPTFDNSSLAKLEKIIPIISDTLPQTIEITQEFDFEKPPAPANTPCAGICFRIKFGSALDKDRYSFLKLLLDNLGFSIKEGITSNYDLISEKAYTNYEDAEVELKKFHVLIKALEGIVSISEIKAEILRL